MTYLLRQCLFLFVILTRHVTYQQEEECVASTFKEAQDLRAAQENFYNCYKDCSSSILNNAVGSSTAGALEFTANLAQMAKTAGMTLCAKKCFGEVAGKASITTSSASHPLVTMEAIARKLLKCATKSSVSDALFMTDLAQFNIDLLDQRPSFKDPKTRKLFSIFYPDHLQTFWEGMKLYDQSSTNCKNIVVTIRGALSAYTNGLSLCQHWCLTQLAGEATNSVNLVGSVARCQLSCFYLFRYESSPKESLLHPVAEMYHFLQYCLWHLGELQEAASYGASFTLLRPEDTSVRDYYFKSGKISRSEFEPTLDAQYFKLQLQALRQTLKIAQDIDSGIVDAAPMALGSLLSSMKAQEIGLGGKGSKGDTASGTCNAASPLCSAGDVKVVGNFSGIDNYRRYVVDGVSNLKTCQTLISFVKRAGRAGDGYRATKVGGSPYTDHETFVGMATSRVAELTTHSVIRPEEALLFFEVTDKALEMTKKMFSLDELYFYYVHLVCREAVVNNKRGETDSERDTEKDPSHPLHADNCSIQKNGDCLYTDPLLLPRNYSAILYLNDNFEGGEFFFASRPERVEQMKVSPRCGRLVSFHASEFHGVKAVTDGSRCALAMWFTMDRSKSESDRIDALHTIKNLFDKNEAVPADPTGPEN